MSLFGEAQRVLSALQTADRLKSAAGPRTEPSDVQKVLYQLGYLEADQYGHPIVIDCNDPATLSNRLSLLGLAGRLKRVFRLPARLAPGACFIGAESTPADFGLPAHSGQTLSAGGRGLNLQSSFQSCIGEAAEHLSLLPSGDEATIELDISALKPGSRVDFNGVQAALPREDELQWMLSGLGLDLKHKEGQLDWLTMAQVNGDACILVPADLCRRRGASLEGVALRPAESNGCAAGANLEAAMAHAISELVERDAVALWWHGGSPPATLYLSPDAQIALDHHIANIRQQQQRHTWFLDITSDLGIPVVAALSCEPDGSGINFGYGAEQDLLTAAESAFLELCQMELAQDLVHLKIEQNGEDALNPIDKAHLKRAQTLNIEHYSQVTPCAGFRKQYFTLRGKISFLEFCVEALKSTGLRVFWLEQSNDSIKIPVVRVLIPGLQSPKIDWASKRLQTLAEANGLQTSVWENLPEVI